MAVLQTNYPDTMAPGYPGMIANGETSNRISRSCEIAAGIAFGKVVFRGADDHGCTTDQTGSPQVLGIAIADEGLASVPGGDANEYQRYDNVAILTQGVIWVTAGEAVTDGAQAYVTSGGAIVDTSTSNTILTGWFFDTTGANASLVKLAKR